MKQARHFAFSMLVLCGLVVPSCQPRSPGSPDLDPRLRALEDRVELIEQKLGAALPPPPAPAPAPAATPAQVAPDPIAEVFVGSRNSDKYHRPTCSSARRISPGNLRTFSSAGDAQRAGYTPCKVCRPPS
jgi:competence protein ComEC